MLTGAGSRAAVCTIGNHIYGRSNLGSIGYEVVLRPLHASEAPREDRICAGMLPLFSFFRSCPTGIFTASGQEVIL